MAAEDTASSSPKWTAGCSRAGRWSSICAQQSYMASLSQSAKQRSVRLRSADPVEQPRARRDSALPVYSACGRNRTDPAARGMGPTNGMRAGGRVEQTGQRRGQSLASAVQEPDDGPKTRLSRLFNKLCRDMEIGATPGTTPVAYPDAVGALRIDLPSLSSDAQHRRRLMRYPGRHWPYCRRFLRRRCYAQRMLLVWHSRSTLKVSLVMLLADELKRCFRSSTFRRWPYAQSWMG